MMPHSLICVTRGCVNRAYVTPFHDRRRRSTLGRSAPDETTGSHSDTGQARLLLDKDVEPPAVGAPCLYIAIRVRLLPWYVADGELVICGRLHGLSGCSKGDVIGRLS